MDVYVKLWNGNTLMNRTDIWSEGFATVNHSLPFDGLLVEQLMGLNNQDIVNALRGFDELTKSECCYVMSLSDILYDALAITYTHTNLPHDRPVTTAVDYFALICDFNDNETYSGESGWDSGVLDEICGLAYRILNIFVIGLSVNLTVAERNVITEMVMTTREVFDLWGDSLMVDINDDIITFTSMLPKTPDPSFGVEEYEVYSGYRSRIDPTFCRGGETLQEIVGRI